MAGYSEYKDSGQQWLGMIPSHWEMVKIRGVLDENTNQNFAHQVSKQLQFKFGTIIPKKLNYDAEDADWNVIEKYVIVRPNDIVINGLNLNYDLLSMRVGLVKEKGIITSAYIIMRPKEGFNPAYLNYAFKGWDSRKLFHGMGTGVRITLSWKELKNYSIPIPPKEEQEAIVEYLDKVTADIDKSIATKEQIIASLEERRKIIITHAVTHGITPDVPMRDSGIDWLGEIPAHWDIKRFKYFADVKANLVTPIKYLEYPQISPDCIEKGTGRLLTVQKVKDSGVISDNHLFFKGQIIYSKIRPNLNKLIIAPFDGLCSADMYPIETKGNVEFLQYLMLSDIFVAQVASVIAERVKMPKINKIELGEIRIPIPPDAEQAQIVSYLASTLDPIESAVSKQKRLIELLLERKNIIINETVTGKVKVI